MSTALHAARHDPSVTDRHDPIERLDHLGAVRRDEGGHPGLIIGFVNDGLAGIPGVLRVSVTSEDGKVNVVGSLDAGYPLPGKVRQAKFPLPKGTNWKGLRLRAEIEVKGQRYPVRWACAQKLNDDGSLTLPPTAGLGQNDETGGVPAT